MMTTKPTLTLPAMKRQYATEDACRTLLQDLRWPGGKIACPRCGKDEKVYKTSQAFRWKCKSCNKNGYRFSVLTGTVFENTNVPLRTWFEVAFLMVSSKKGISALQVHRMIDPVRGKRGSYKTAWYMCHRIRAAMTDPDFLKLTGVVEIDETYVGGAVTNRPKRERKRRQRGVFGGKVGVIGAIARKGNVTARVIARMDTATVDAFVNDTVADAVSLVATDEQSIYRDLDWGPLRRHASVKHSRGEYVRGNVHTAYLDQFWSLLKRGIMGSFHKVSKTHLPLYLNEFSWRHNHRNDPNIFRALLAGC
jgi:transposase-like protein